MILRQNIVFKIMNNNLYLYKRYYYFTCLISRSSLFIDSSANTLKSVSSCSLMCVSFKTFGSANSSSSCSL